MLVIFIYERSYAHVRCKRECLHLQRLDGARPRRIWYFLFCFVALPLKLSGVSYVFLLRVQKNPPKNRVQVLVQEWVTGGLASMGHMRCISKEYMHIRHNSHSRALSVKIISLLMVRIARFLHPISATVETLQEM